MACVANLPPANADSEMEEGEIVDDLDELSDISSEEEFLLRQRLEVLENYNNVLERKKAKTSFCESGKEKNEDALSHDLSDISDREDSYPLITIENKKYKQQYSDIHQKQKRRKEVVVLNVGKNKEHKKKSHRPKKKPLPKIRISESSEESEDEYRNKRRKLANAVSFTKVKNDTSSLKDRLEKMLCGRPNFEPVKEEEEKVAIDIAKSLDWSLNTCSKSDNVDLSSKNNSDNPISIDTLESQMNELIDLCQEDEKPVDDVTGHDCVDSVTVEEKKIEASKDANRDSDEDLELLRQHALKTKVSKSKTVKTLDVKVSEVKPTNISEDEDSDTAELRLICLKSALLKKAIEVKQKQKLRKRLSQSFQDEFNLDDNKLSVVSDADNNTDIESVDMDIGSDGDEKLKELSNNYGILDETKRDTATTKEINILNNSSKKPKEDELEEDEDLLRAKLLTSLSKNLPNLIHPTVMNTINEIQKSDKTARESKTHTTKTAPEEKPFIIKLGESDSEGEHEATKNLTKMHLKLSEQIDFQQKLDLFLKSTRMEVEKKTLPDVVQEPTEQPKPAPKFVAKAVKHLPKSEQIEYKNLVKRMAELEKIKQARQSSMNLSKMSIQAKETLKPRNVTIETGKNGTTDNLEEQIATSRKKIAEESSKMLKLKEEATKLSQKYKIVETELRNISTAITLNRKQQKAVQNRLSNIRLQHQMLVKRSSSLKHSKINMPLVNRTNGKSNPASKLQKENNPSKEEYKNPNLLKSVKVSVHNDLKEDNAVNSRLSVQVDVSSNKKIVKLPKNAMKERIVDINVENPTDSTQEENDTTHPVVEKGGGLKRSSKEMLNANDSDIEKIKEVNDYKSPLEALHRGTWSEDPNSFLCPFEVGGSCKDPDCKYIHPKVPSDQ